MKVNKNHKKIYQLNCPSLRFYLLFLTLFLTIQCFTEVPVEPKFGAITPSEFAMKNYDKDTSANALVLFDYGDAKIILTSERQFKIQFKQHLRIKIFKNTDPSIGKFKIKLFKAGLLNQVINEFKATTFNMEDGHLEKSKVINEQTHTNTQFDYDLKSFSFPDIRDGSIIELSYTMNSDLLYHFMGWDFEGKYPVVWSQYHYVIPEYFDFRRHAIGFLPFEINSTVTGSTLFTVHFASENPAGLDRARTSNQDYDIRAANSEYVLAMKDIPAFHAEPDIDCEENYMQSISFELVSMSLPGEFVNDFSTTWAELNSHLIKDTYFGGPLKDSKIIQNKVNELCLNHRGNEEKALAIYNYVQVKIDWKHDYQQFLEEDLQSIIVKGTGSLANANSLLLHMLRIAGIKADPVLINRRQFGNKIRYQPGISEYSSIIVLAEINNSNILLDAATNYCPFSMLPPDDINGFGRLIVDGDGASVPLAPNDKYKVAKSYVMNIDDKGIIKGTIISNFSGYAAFEVRKEIGASSVSHHFKRIELKNPGLTIEKSSIDGLNSYGSISDTLVTTIVEQTVTKGNTIRFNPLLYEQIKTARYSQPERKYQIDFNYPISYTYLFEYHIPVGYEIDSLPSSVNLKLPDNSVTLSYIIVKENDIIRLVYRQNINRHQFSTEEYLDLKAIFEQIALKNMGEVILKKK